MAALPAKALATKSLKFATPSEVSKKFQPVGVLHSPYPISWADEERDVTAWIGNELQNEAFDKLYRLRDKIRAIDHPDFTYVWNFLQGSDHFYYMATKWFSDGDVHSYFNPYDSPYEAFINYMNVLSDFEIEVDKKYGAASGRSARSAYTINGRRDVLYIGKLLYFCCSKRNRRGPPLGKQPSGKSGARRTHSNTWLKE